MSDESVLRKFGVPSLAYYCTAIGMLPPPVHIVSDDPDWCSDKIVPLAPGSMVSRERSHFSDLAILFNSSSIALSNSTFSWWGAFSDLSETVIAPDPWMDDPREPNLGLEGWVYLDKYSGTHRA